MPGRDNTGPEGQGPASGQGLGKCNPDRKNGRPGQGRGQQPGNQGGRGNGGPGRGLGRGNRNPQGNRGNF